MEQMSLPKIFFCLWFAAYSLVMVFSRAGGEGAPSIFGTLLFSFLFAFIALAGFLWMNQK